MFIFINYWIDFLSMVELLYWAVVRENHLAFRARCFCSFGGCFDFGVNPFMPTHRIRRNLSSSLMKINSVGIRKRKKIIFSEKKLKTANWQAAFVFSFFVLYAHICWDKQMLLTFLESCYREKVYTFFRMKLSWKL